MSYVNIYDSTPIINNNNQEKPHGKNKINKKIK